MPRAKIDYPALRNELFKKYPMPLYRDVTLLVPHRSNRIKAPTTIYDRSQGNYARIGYKVQVRLEQFMGIVESYDGFRAKYERRSFEDVLFID